MINVSKNTLNIKYLLRFFSTIFIYLITHYEQEKETNKQKKNHPVRHCLIRA